MFDDPPECMSQKPVARSLPVYSYTIASGSMVLTAQSQASFGSAFLQHLPQSQARLATPGTGGFVRVQTAKLCQQSVAGVIWDPRDQPYTSGALCMLSVMRGTLQSVRVSTLPLFSPTKLTGHASICGSMTYG